MTIEWREAEKTDRAVLQSFRCTDPAPNVSGGHRRLPHPRKWEQDVEKAIHKIPAPTRGQDGVTLLGFDGADLVAIVTWCRIAQQASTLFKLRLLAVAIGERTRSGKKVGETALQAISEAMRRIGGDGQSGDVFALVRVRNLASQRLLENSGFQRLEDFPVNEPDYEAWGAAL